MGRPLFLLKSTPLRASGGFQGRGRKMRLAASMDGLTVRARARVPLAAFMVYVLLWLCWEFGALGRAFASFLLDLVISVRVTHARGSLERC